METLSNLALLALPVGGVVALGAWLLRSVFPDVSLKDTSPDASYAEQRAEGLEFQLAVAEELGLDAFSLNHLKDQVDLAQEDAERARQSEAERQTVPETVPWFAPVAAVHSIAPHERQNGTHPES